MSDGDDHEQVLLNSKKKRPRACDHCRRRKVRCDGIEEDGNPCSTCVAVNEKCTYTTSGESRKMRQADEGYVKALEAEVLRLRRELEETKFKGQDQSPKASSILASGRAFAAPQAHPSAADVALKEEETDDQNFLEGFRFLSLHEKKHVRFMGRSGSFPLIKAAIRMRDELAPESSDIQSGARDDVAAFSRRRTRFWYHFPDYIPPDQPYTDFPDIALMSELFDQYFRAIHPSLPVLHWPTFLQNAGSGLHLVDGNFGALVLLVCALGARFSHNPVTLPPGATTWQVAGWQWFEQVRERRKLIPLTPTTLHDIQVSMLAGTYVATLGLPQANYTLVGHGLRLAHDLGAHRRTTYSATPTIEDELRKRSFWCLVAMDRGICTVLGRPCAIYDEDFDLDYPIDCDDEFWVSDDPQKAFKQPHGTPSKISQFIWHVKLSQIHARALRTIYSSQGAKDIRDPESAQQIVAELDSELNHWIDSLPQHLVYDPNREDVPFAAQAASLHATYHSLRIFIHRPFVTMHRTVPVPFPSLTICTHASRACIQAIERYFALAGPVLVFQYHLGSLFAAAAVLMLSTWQRMRDGISVEAAKELEHVNKAMEVFKSLELHWDVAGRFWDILHDLVTAIESALHKASNRQNERLSPGDIAGTPYAEQPTQSSSHGYDHLAPSRENTPQEVWANTLQAASTPPWEMTPPAPPTPPDDFEAMFAELLPVFQYHDSLGGISPQGFTAGMFLPEGTGKGEGAPQGYVPGYSPEWAVSPESPWS